ncbi:hypothetical protein [Pseudophaeobacter sp. EL27]|uniref:hypothetical protein n=1 Tax=Pseudophaeobacter sp. EL27 TaxID=2107580 RepID=UPI000EFD5F94|nr:hypothetical protein [Pseudophaeobacter sp. EL27]
MFRPEYLALALCTAALPLPATAGAWKHPVDGGFAATSFTLRRSDQGLVSEFGFYRDFGVSPHFDLGIDLTHQGSQRVGLPGRHSGQQSGHVLVFARLPLRQGASKTQIAAELALGSNHTNLLWHPMYRVSLSAGRSKATQHGNLWGNLDLIYEQRGDAPHPLWKVNGSFGLDSNRRVSPLLQIETSFGRDTDLSYSLTPSLRIKLAGFSFAGKQRFENSELTIGLEYRRANTQSLGLKIALWQRF